jgi:hypothetical protein
MGISLPILVGVLAGFGGALALSWYMVGIYLDQRAEGEDPIGIVQVRNLSRLPVDKRELGYLDAFLGFHCHFYSAELHRDGERRLAVVLRYFPDAFGKPFAERIHGRRIIWYPMPDLRGLQVWRGIFLVWRASKWIAPIGWHTRPPAGGSGS